ncbi:MAG: hypothetical protein NUW37_07495 [Planctomycetes bacterium]|nr:hypothetical protein [Planctomycetota bacterium]
MKKKEKIWFELIMSNYPRGGCIVPLEFGNIDLPVPEIELFNTGLFIDSWDERAYFRSEERKTDGPATDCITGGTRLDAPAFSPRAREALEREGVGQNDVQWLPVHIYQSTGEEIEGFEIMNVLSIIEGIIDYRSSTLMNPNKPEFDPITGKFNSGNIMLSGLRGDLIKEHDIVRAKEKPTRLFVSDRFEKVWRSLKGGPDNPRGSRGAKLFKLKVT